MQWESTCAVKEEGSGFIGFNTLLTERSCFKKEYGHQLSNVPQGPTSNVFKAYCVQTQIQF